MGRKSRAREKTIQIAQRLFLEESYATVSVDKICQAAGINKGSFYYFFPSKDALLLEVIERNWEFLKKSLYAPTLSGSGSPVERIKNFFDVLHTNAAQTRGMLGHAIACPVGVFGAEIGLQDEAIRKKVGDIFNEFEIPFEETLREAKEKGEVPPETDTKLTAAMLVAYMQGILLMSKSRDDVDLLKDLAAGAMKLIR